ncbi:MAG: hypothetical protein ACOYJG_08595 [Prevotella sp.]|jgi:hypothetical protein
MKKTTLLLATAVALLVPSGALAQRSHLQPTSGTLYLGSDSATQSNPQAELTFDSHGNETTRTSGTFSSMTVSGHDYDYSKGYAVLLNEYEATLTEDSQDTIWTRHTWLNDDGIRYKMSLYSNSTYQQEDGFIFDDAGRITQIEMKDDSTYLTWKDDTLSSYKHIQTGWGSRTIELNDVEVAFDRQPFDVMQYNYDDLLNQFNTYHVFINATGHYTYKSSWPQVDVDGDIKVSTYVKPNYKHAEQLAMINDTDTLSYQVWDKLDRNGSYKVTSIEPKVYPGQMTISYVTYNEFGDKVMQIDSVGYEYNGEMQWEVSRDSTPTDYEGVKPMRKMDYYWDTTGESWVLGSLIVYNEWDEKPIDPIYDPVIVERQFSDRQIPQSGSQYSGDDTSYQNPTAEYSYDEHFNMISKTTGTMSSQNIEEWEYNYSKGYPFLSSHSTYTLNNKGEKSDEFIFWETTYDDNGIRTGVSGMDMYGSEITGYHFDALGHVDSLINESDSTIISWDGEDMKSYYYNHPSSWSARKIVFDSLSIGYADRTFNAMQADFGELSYSDLMRDFKSFHTCINADGYYYSKDYSGDVLEGTLTVRTKVSDDQQDVYSVTIVNGLDTLVEQKIHFNDEYGSFTQTLRHPYESEYYTIYDYTYNEYGDLIRTVYTQPSYDGNYYTTEELDTVIYEEDKPVRMEHYYYKEGQAVLGYTIVYDEWISTGINATKRDFDATKGAQLYTIDGRKVADLSASQLMNGNFGLSLQGIYILRQGNNAKKIILHK